MEIYVEYIFLDNLAINALLLYITLFVQKKDIKMYKIFLSAAFGAVFSVLYPFLGFYNYIVKALLAVVMILIIRKFKNLTDYLSTLFVFYIISFSLAGAVLMLSNFTEVDLTKYSGKIQLFPFCLAGSAFIIVVLIKFCMNDFYKRKKITSLLYRANVQTEGGDWLEVKAFYDSGNHLYDPVSGLPIVIISNNLYQKLHKEDCGQVKIKSVAGERNLMITNIVFRIYFNDKMNKMYKVKAGITKDLNIEYDLILHTEMTENNE